MVQSNIELLNSYEHDLKEHITLLKSITDDANPASQLDKNQFALENATKLLKQMEVEAMNHMENDDVRKRVSYLSIILTSICKKDDSDQSSVKDALTNKLCLVSNVDVQVQV